MIRKKRGSASRSFCVFRTTRLSETKTTTCRIHFSQKPRNHEKDAVSTEENREWLNNGCSIPIESTEKEQNTGSNKGRCNQPHLRTENKPKQAHRRNRLAFSKNLRKSGSHRYDQAGEKSCDEGNDISPPLAFAMKERLASDNCKQQTRDRNRPRRSCDNSKRSQGNAGALPNDQRCNLPKNRSGAQSEQ